jgi:hypothetical protein
MAHLSSCHATIAIRFIAQAKIAFDFPRLHKIDSSVQD